MNRNEIEQRNGIFLATALATRGQRRLALVIAAVTAILFLIAIPLVRVPLAAMPAFIPSYEAALFFIDLITAVLLYDQFARIRSPAILILASAYLFEALIIIPHALSFPGAFTSTGLLGAKEQTTAWLWVFWHGGFTLLVIAYAILRRHETDRKTVSRIRPLPMIVASFLGAALLAAAFTLAATWGHDALPIVMQGNDYSLIVRKGITPGVWLVTLVAVLVLWRRQIRVLDLWLMLVMWVWLFDVALSGIIGSSRYDLGFYAGRIFGLIASGFLLITLVVELAKMYAGMLSAVLSAEQKLARLRDSESKQHTERTGSFVSRQNIAHYRSLLESGTLDPAQRRSIEALLSEEERRQDPSSATRH